MTKRIFSLLLAAMLIISSASTVSAAEATTPSTEVTDNIIAKSPSMYTFNGYTSTSWSSYYPIYPSTSGSFSGQITVDGPCTLYLLVYNSNYTQIGTSSLNITGSGTYNITPSPSTVSAGTYYVRYRFNRSGVKYTMNLYTP